MTKATTKAGNQQAAQPDAQPTAAGTNATVWGRVSQTLGEAFKPRPPRQAAGQPGQQTGPGWGRMTLGLVAYMIGSMALQYGLLIADGYFKLHLATSRQTLFPANWPIVGSMTKFALIYLLVLLAYVWLLFRLNIIPRDLFRPRGSTTGRTGASTTTTTSASLGRSKSARRRAGLTATTTTAAPKHASTTIRGGAARATRTEVNDAATTNGKYDDEYTRVRSLNRRRRGKR